MPAVWALPMQMFVLAILPLILMIAGFIYAAYKNDSALMSQVIGYIPRAILSPLVLNGGAAVHKLISGWLRSS